MKKELTVSVNYPSGEEGLSIACREGKLFRNDPDLEALYKDGYRIYNYTVVEEENSRQRNVPTRVRVYLEK